MARYWRERLLRRRQVATSLRHVTDRAVRDRQVPLPAGVGGIQRGQPLGDGQVLGDTPAPPPPGRREPAPRHRPGCTRPPGPAASRCWRDPARPAARRWPAYWANACSAAARSPRACATSPTRLYAIASSRCQPVLVGSSAASRSKMARYWVNACSARRQVAASLRHVTDPAVRDRQVSAASRCWRDPARPAARRWPGTGRYACSAAARSPRACATSPTQLYAPASSRCQPVLAGSSPASRSKMARYWVIRLLRRRQVAASLRHVTDRAVRARQVPLPAGVGWIQPGQPLGDGQVLA